MSTQFSFAKLDEVGWGVKCSADQGETVKFAGQTVEVRKRDGKTKEVELGEMLDSWNAGRAAIYATKDSRPRKAAARNGNGNGSTNGAAVAALAWSTRMLSTIHAELDGQSWEEQSAEELEAKLDAIAEIFRAEGFTIRTAADVADEAVAA